VDWHPRFEIAVQPGKSTLSIRHHGLFGYALPFSPPRLAERSMSLKIVSSSGPTTAGDSCSRFPSARRATTG
jgi:hypothetical protein